MWLTVRGVQIGSEEEYRKVLEDNDSEGRPPCAPGLWQLRS